ncbi:MAG: acyl-CoA dehydrogenase family protein [Pseudomonadota bacterium]
MIDTTFLDWPFFDDSHRDLARRLDEWCQREIAPLGHSEEDVDGQCRHLLSLLAKGGWLRYAVPKAYGGALDELDVRSLCLIRETLGRYSGLADFVFAMQGLGSGTITVAGTEAQKQAYLPRVANGSYCAAFALTELASGSDVAAMDSSAEDCGDHYVVNGAKTYISNGGIADFYTLFVRTGEAPGARGISAMIVDADTPGLEVAERIHVMAPHPLATLTFTDMVVPKDKLIAQPGAGFKAAMGTLDIFRTTVGAAGLGFARRALEEALERTTSRKLFGKELVQQPVVQADLAEMALKVDTSALLIYRSGWTRDVMGRRNSREAAMAKLHATETAQEVIDKSLQMHGGLGVVHGQMVESLYREIRALRIYEGASEVQRVVIARQLLDQFSASQVAHQEAAQ